MRIEMSDDPGVAYRIPISHNPNTKKERYNPLRDPKKREAGRERAKKRMEPKKIEKDLKHLIGKMRFSKTWDEYLQIEDIYHRRRLDAEGRVEPNILKVIDAMYEDIVAPQMGE